MKESTRDWIELVKRDLKAAGELVDDEYVANIVLFHCQQSVEKVLKAVLEEFEVDVPKVHSIIRLYSLLPQQARENVKTIQAELELLDEIYISVRYPLSIGMLPEGFPTKKRAEETLKLSSRIVNDIMKYLQKKQV